MQKLVAEIEQWTYAYDDIELLEGRISDSLDMLHIVGYIDKARSYNHCFIDKLDDLIWGLDTAPREYFLEMIERSLPNIYKMIMRDA